MQQHTYAQRAHNTHSPARLPVPVGRHPGLLPFGNSAFGTPHHTTPHRTAPHCTAPHRTTPHHTAQYSTAQHRRAPHCTTPHHTTPHHTTPHHTTPHHTTPHHTTPHHTTPHHTTAWHNITELQFTSGMRKWQHTSKGLEGPGGYPAYRQRFVLGRNYAAIERSPSQAAHRGWGRTAPAVMMWGGIAALNEGFRLREPIPDSTAPHPSPLQKRGQKRAAQPQCGLTSVSVTQANLLCPMSDQAQRTPWVPLNFWVLSVGGGGGKGGSGLVPCQSPGGGGGWHRGGGVPDREWGVWYGVVW